MQEEVYDKLTPASQCESHEGMILKQSVRVYLVEISESGLLLLLLLDCKAGFGMGAGREEYSQALQRVDFKKAFNLDVTSAFL